jgi:hypothetical protein
MWDDSLRNIDIVICKAPYFTHQVLLDALAISWARRTDLTELSAA